MNHNLENNNLICAFFKGGWIGTPANWVENNIYMKNINQVR